MNDREQLGDFGTFYERNYPAALRVAYGIVGEQASAEDATQEAFATAYRQRDRYRGEGPAEAWLYRIVVNTAIGALRRRRVRWIEPLDPITVDRPAAELPSTTDRAALSEGLQRLDPRSRSVVVLRYYLDFDYGRIAMILGTSESNVGSILSRALDRLRAVMAPAAGPSEGPSVAVRFAKEVRRHG
jgi:RNA polymerase sigma-70 factor (ECF subfamily)